METIAPNQDLTQVATKWQDTMLSLEKVYEQEPEVLKIGGVAIGTLGNFSASIGKAKSKKTFNVSAMVAAALSGKEVLNYTTDFPDRKNRILYIDTEQSQNHCMIVIHRIMKLAKLPTNEDCDRFYFLSLRKFNPKERLAIIDDAISQIEGLGFVVIDGIRDLVYDINSPSEATCVISKLMQWTDEYQIHLHTILHQNKSDENARGHIGTEINNKAETIIQIDKETGQRRQQHQQSGKCAYSFKGLPAIRLLHQCPITSRTSVRLCADKEERRSSQAGIVLPL